jgi:hypothetical protein
MIRLQALSQRCQLKLPLLGFGQDPDTRQQAQHPIQRLCMRAGQTGKLGGALRTIFQQIG